MENHDAERIRNLELQVARLIAHIESEQGSLNRVHRHQTDLIEHISKLVEKHEKLILGEEVPGIVVRTDRLEQAEERRKISFRFIWALISAILFKILVDLIMK